MANWTSRWRPSADRLALVTVHLSGVPYVIVYIGLRMLKPHELFRAQGFPASYIIDRTQDGRQVSNSRAVALVGNSVSPPPLIAILEANVGAAVEPQLVEAAWWSQRSPGCTTATASEPVTRTSADGTGVGRGSPRAGQFTHATVARICGGTRSKPSRRMVRPPHQRRSPPG